MSEWSKVLTEVPWPLMVWSTFALGTYQLSFISWVFHGIFSFVHFISLYTLGCLRAFRKPLPYNIYLFNLRIANHTLIIKTTKNVKPAIVRDDKTLPGSNHYLSAQSSLTHQQSDYYPSTLARPQPHHCQVTQLSHIIHEIQSHLLSDSYGVSVPYSHKLKIPFSQKPWISSLVLIKVPRGVYCITDMT